MKDVVSGEYVCGDDTGDRDCGGDTGDGDMVMMMMF